MIPEPSTLEFPHREPPAFGMPMQVAPGVLWLRLPLPYALDHVNLYLFEEADGWALFDAGIGDELSIALWSDVLAGPLGGKPIKQLVVSHYHPDHVGMAGWLDERFAMPLHMTQADYLYCRLLRATTQDQRKEDRGFYQAQGLSEAEIDAILERGKSYLQRTTGLPDSFDRLIDGETLQMGGRTWRILTGGGHAPEQAMLWCEADRLFLSADQVLARISPNVSVLEVEPRANPLGQYLASLAEIQDIVSDNVLVLPGHNLPFYGLHERLDQLTRHHEYRCELVAAACRDTAKTCFETVPVLFRRTLDSHQMSFALGETLAHLNLMVRRGQLATQSQNGVLRYRTV